MPIVPREALHVKDERGIVHLNGERGKMYARRRKVA